MPGHNTGNKLFKKIYLNYKYIKIFKILLKKIFKFYTKKNKEDFQK